MKKVLTLGLVFLLMVGFSSAIFAEQATPDAETLLEQVPSGAYRLDQKITFSNLPDTGLLRDPSNVLIDALFDRGYLKNTVPPFSENPETDPNLERVSAETVESVFNSLFGPGSYDLIEHDRFIGPGVLEYLDGSEEYVYYEFPGGGDASCWIREDILSVEEKDGTLVIQVRYGLFWLSYRYPCSIMGDASFQTYEQPYEEARLAYVDDGQLDLFKEGGFDEYLPAYAHTFKANGDGTYYWESTEMIEAPKTIPETMGLSPSRVKSSSETEEPATDDPVTDIPSTDLPVETASDSSAAPSEKQNGGVTWFLVGLGVGAVAVVIPAAIILLVKGKKR